MLQQIASQLSAVLDDRTRQVGHMRQLAVQSLDSIAAICRVTRQSEAISQQAAVEATLRATLTSPLPIFTAVVIDALCDAYISLLMAGDSRPVRNTCEFLLKHATAAGQKGHAPLGPHSSRAACLILLGRLGEHFHGSLGAEAHDMCFSVMKLVVGAADRSSSGLSATGTFRAAACTALYRLLNGLGSRLLPAKVLGGASSDKSEPFSDTGKLHTAVLDFLESIVCKDLSPSVRACLGPTVQALATGSAGFRFVTMDELLRVTTSRLCDPHPVPRLAAAFALATVLATSVLATRVGAVAAEAAAVAVRMAALRGGNDSDEEGSGTGVVATIADASDRVGTGVEGDDGLADQPAPTRTAGLSAGPAILGGFKKLGDSVRKAAIAAGKLGERREKPQAAQQIVMSSEAAAAAAAAVSAGPQSALRKAMAQVAAGARVRAGPERGMTALNASSAVAYICGLMRGAGKLAVRYGGRAGDVRAAAAIAGRSLIRSIRTAAGGTTDAENQLIVKAALLALRSSDMLDSGSVPTIHDVSVACGGLPRNGPHAQHMRACVVHLLQDGLLGDPSPRGAFVPPLWNAWKVGVMDSLVELVRQAVRVRTGGIAVARVESSNVHQEQHRQGRSPRSPNMRVRIPSSAALKKITSKLTFMSPRGVGSPDLPAGPTGAEADSGSGSNGSNVPISDSALVALLQIIQHEADSLWEIGAESSMERAADVVNILLPFVCIGGSEQLRTHASRLLTIASGIAVTTLTGSITTLLSSLRASHAALVSEGALSAIAASAAGSALADAHLLGSRRKAGIFVGTAQNVMIHAGSSPVTACVEGFGIPGAGPGSGCGVVTGTSAAHLRCLCGASDALSQLLGLVSHKMEKHEFPANVALFSESVQLAGILMAWNAEQRAIDKLQIAVLQSGSSSSAVALLAQSATQAAYAEVKAAFVTAGAKILAGACNLGGDWLLDAPHWPSVYVGIARCYIRFAASMRMAGIGTSKEGNGAFLLSPLGLPPVAAAASVLMGSSLTAQLGEDGVVFAASADSVVADSAGFGTARSVYSGVAGAWEYVAFAAASRGLQAVIQTFENSGLTNVSAFCDLFRLARLGLTVITACPLVPGHLSQALHDAPDRNMARLLQDAAAQLQLRLDSAGCISFGGDGSSAGDSPTAVVRGIPYGVEDAHLYTPAGVSLAAVALARRSVLDVASSLMNSAACLSFDAAQSEPIRGAVLSAVFSIVTAGCVALVPLELGMISVETAELQLGKGTDRTSIQLPVLTLQPLLDNATLSAHVSAVDTALCVLTSRPDEETWSPLTLTLGHTQPASSDYCISLEDDQLSLDISAINLAARACGTEMSTSLVNVEERTLREVLGSDSMQSMHKSVHISPCTSALKQVHSTNLISAKNDPLLRTATGLKTRSHGTTESAIRAAGQVLAMVWPHLTHGQAQLLTTALVTMLRPLSNNREDEPLPTVGYRVAVSTCFHPTDRLTVQRNAAVALCGLLQHLHIPQAKVSAAAPFPVAWLQLLIAPLSQGLSSIDGQIRFACASGLAHMVRASGPFLGRKLVLAVSKQLKAVSPEAVAAAVAVSAATAGDATALNEAAACATAGGALALSLMQRASVLVTACANNCNQFMQAFGSTDVHAAERTARLTFPLPLALVTGAVDEQQIWDCAQDTRASVRPMLLASCALLVDTHAMALSLMKSGGQVDSAVQTEASLAFRTTLSRTLSLCRQHLLATQSPLEPSATLGSSTVTYSKAAGISWLQSPQGLSGSCDAVSTSRLALQANVRLDSQGALSCSIVDGTDMVSPCVALAMHSETISSWLPGDGMLVAESDLKSPGQCAALETAVAKNAAADAAVLSVIHPATHEIIPAAFVLAAAEAAMGATSARHQLSLSTDSSQGGEDSHTVRVLRGMRAVTTALHTRTGQVSARAMALAVAYTLQEGGSHGMQAGTAELGRDAANHEHVITLICLLMRGACKGLAAIADRWEGKAMGSVSTNTLAGTVHECCVLLASLSGAANNRTATVLLAEASHYLAAATGHANGSKDLDTALIAHAMQLGLSRSLCMGPGAVAAMSSSIQPLPEVLGGGVLGCLLPDPLALLTSKDSAGRALAAHWSLMLDRIGVPFAAGATIPCGIIGRSIASGQLTAVAQVRGSLASGLVSCGIAMGSDSSAVESGQTASQQPALSTRVLRACGRPDACVLRTTGHESAQCSLIMLALSASASCANSIRMRGLAIEDILRCWSRMRSDDGPPGYFVSLGALGDVLCTTVPSNQQEDIAACVLSVVSNPMRTMDVLAALGDAMTGQQSKSQMNAAFFSQALAERSSTTSNGKSKVVAGGDFGGSGRNEEEEEEVTESSSDKKGEESMDPSIAACDTDAARIALSPDAESLLRHFDNGVWRGLDDAGKALAASVTASMVSNASVAHLLTPTLVSLLALAACDALEADHESDALGAPGPDLMVGMDVSMVDDEGVEDGSGTGDQAAPPPSASPLRQAGARLLLSLLHSCQTMADPDVPGSHALAQHSAAITAALIPSLSSLQPVSLLLLTVPSAVACVECGIFTEVGTFRRLVRTLGEMSTDKTVCISAADLVRLAGLSAIVGLAAWQPPNGSALFERSLPSALRKYEDKLPLQPVPPSWPSSGRNKTYRLSVFARKAIWTSLRKDAGSSFTFLAQQQYRNSGQFAHLFLHAVGSLAIASCGRDVFAPVGANFAKGKEEDALKIDTDSFSTASRLCLIYNCVPELVMLLSHPVTLTSLTPVEVNAVHACVQSHGSIRIVSAISGGEDDAIDAFKVAVDSLASCMRMSINSLDDVVQCVARASSQPSLRTDLVIECIRTLGDVAGAVCISQHDRGIASPVCAALTRVCVAAFTTCDAGATSLQPAFRAFLLRALNKVAEQSASLVRDSILPALALVWEMTEQQALEVDLPQVWHKCVWPLVATSIFILPDVLVGMSAVLAHTLAGLDPNSLSIPVGWNTRGIVPAFDGCASILMGADLSCCRNALACALRALRALYNCPALTNSVQGSGCVYEANELTRSAGMLFCGIVQHMCDSDATQSENFIVPSLLAVSPVLLPGGQPSQGTDTGWISFDTQRAVATLALGLAKSYPLAFRQGLAKLDTDRQAELRAVLQASLSGGRRERTAFGTAVTSGTSKENGPQTNKPVQVAQFVQKLAAGGSLKFDSSKFKGGPRQAPEHKGPKPAVADFMARDDDFSRALRARAAGQAATFGDDNEDNASDIPEDAPEFNPDGSGAVRLQQQD